MNDHTDKRRLRVEWPPTVIVREVIEVQFRRGEGVAPDDPVRVVTAYHDLDGTLLAENDPVRGTIR
jgi:hypothetical protein